MKSTDSKAEQESNPGVVSGALLGGGGDAPDFISELRELINKHSMENGSNTPDFILAQYLTNCLRVWNAAMTAREKWYGREPQPVEPPNAPDQRPGATNV